VTGFFDAALAACEALDGTEHALPGNLEPNTPSGNLLLVRRALVEAVALNRGIRAEAEQARQRLADAPRVTVAELSVDDLLAELRRRLA
jgi:hypothetical protein